MKKVRTSCPHCHTHFKVRPYIIGQKRPCPKCETLFWVRIDLTQSEPELPRQSKSTPYRFRGNGEDCSMQELLQLTQVAPRRRRQRLQTIVFQTPEPVIESGQRMQLSIDPYPFSVALSCFVFFVAVGSWLLGGGLQ